MTDHRTDDLGVAAVRFGVSADAHLMGGTGPASHVAHFEDFVEAMARWKPDFVLDLGDFACQCENGPTTPEMHDCQLDGLRHAWAGLSRMPVPAYIAMGNHDVGWFSNAGAPIRPDDLYLPQPGRGGEDITKTECLAVTKMPGRHYSFDVKGRHFIVLDGNNFRGETAVPPGRDGVEGAYWIDDAQKAWLAADLAANRGKIKVVFCHEELHHTPPEGSGQGGDVPFPPVGKEVSYVDNGWELREMFEADGNVAAVFAAHKHRSRWTVYGGVNYVTLAALHWGCSYARVTLSDRLCIEGAGGQRNYALPLSAAGR